GSPCLPAWPFLSPCDIPCLVSFFIDGFASSLCSVLGDESFVVVRALSQSCLATSRLWAASVRNSTGVSACVGQRRDHSTASPRTAACPAPCWTRQLPRSYQARTCRDGEMV